MSTIKVLHVIARMNVGGTARYVEELIKNIPDSALATGYVQDAEVEDPAVESLPVFRIAHLGRKISPIADFKAWRELSKVVQEQKPAILHTHTFKAGFIGRLTRGPHKQIHTFHGHLFDDNSFGFFKKQIIILTEKLLAHKTDFFISVGEEVGLALREKGIGSKAKWVSIAPGVHPLPIISKIESRKILGLPKSAFIVGWLARMAPVKNPHLFIKVALKLPDVDFVMGGGGELLAEIKLIAPSNVKVIGWTEASVFWSAIDVAISTSNNEGMPVALIEAQIAGVSVIATGVGSTTEVVKNGVTGIIVDKHPESFVKAINFLKTQTIARKMIEQSAKVRATQFFSVKSFVSAHQAVYEELIK
jgi:glycosyltransferase involved in cell wall biosynthesis